MFGFTGAKFRGTWGRDQLQIITDSANEQNFKPKRFNVFNCAAKTINGMQAPKDFTFVTFFNITNNLITINNQNSGAIVGNRFAFPNAAQQNIKAGYGYTFWYDFNSQVWRLTEQPHVIGVSPISVSAGNGISMPQAATSTAGFLAAGDWNTFSNKVSPIGATTAGNVAYWYGGSSLTGLNGFVFKPITQRLGIQNTTPLAPLHVKSTVLETVPDPSSVSASLVQFTPLVTPNSDTITRIAGRLMNPDSPVAVENASGVTSWLTGDTFDYKISSYNDDGMGTFTESASVTTFTQVVLAADFNGIDLSWAADNSGQNGISGYYLYRSVNSGAWEWLDVGNTSTYTDDQSGMTSGDFPSANGGKFNDYVADGVVTDRDYQVYTKRTQIGIDVFSGGFQAYSIPITADNKPYWMSHVIDPDGEPTARTLMSTDLGTTFPNGIDGLSFYEFPETLTTDVDVSTTLLGWFSDGTILNREYRLYNKGIVSSTLVYSTGSVTTSTTDPNDGNYYYASIAWACSGGNGWKLLVDDDLDTNYDRGHSETTASSTGTWYDADNGSYPYGDGVGVTPSGVQPTICIFEKDGTSTSDAAHFTLKGTADYSRFDFIDNADLVQSSIESDATSLRLKAAVISISPTSTLALNIGTNPRLTASSTGGALVGGGNDMLRWTTAGVDDSVEIPANVGLEANGNFAALAGFKLAYRARTSAWTIVASDYLIDCTSGTFAITLPSAAATNIGVGKTYVIKNSGTGVITANTTSSQTIDGVTSIALNQYEALTVMSNGANWIIV